MERYFIVKKLGPWLLLVIFFSVCYFSQNEKSVTVDEFSHLPSGIYNLKTLDWRMDRESPPLIKCFPALTTIITKPDIDVKSFRLDPNPWTFGYDFMFRNKEKYKQIFKFGRCAVILLGCLGGFLLYQFAKEIYGYKGALLALFLYVFNPNIIAHSRLTTIDVGTSCTIFLSIYCFWKFLKRRNGLWCMAAGTTLGLAQLSKFTALILYPIFSIIFVVSIIQMAFFKKNSTMNKNATIFFKSTIYFFLVLLISLFVINAGYIFSGTFIPISEYDFLSKALKIGSAFCWKSLPVPLPYDYLTGFDAQLAISEGNNPFYIGYLMGEHSLTGWWYYYIVAFVVKTPVVLLAMFGVVLLDWIFRREDRPDPETNLCIWLPIIVFFVYFSFFTHIPIGIRFLLPIFPFLFLVTGYLYQVSFMKGKVGRIVMGIAVVVYLIPSVSIFPNYLSYFNLLAGGPEHGYQWLIDSNLDWGQDLPVLKRYLENKGIKKIKLGYFGRVDPRIYGIDYTLAKKEIEKGIYAISVNFLVGRPYYLLKENSKELQYVDLDYFKRYRFLEPTDVLGNTIYVFYCDGTSVKGNTL